MRGQRGFFGHRTWVSSRNPRFSGDQRDTRADPAFHSTLSEAKSETAKLDATLIRLQKEVEELEKQRALQLQHDTVSQKLFLRWAGISIDEATEQECHVTFLPTNENEKVYQIGFQKIGQYWRVSFCNLPYCMTMVPHTVIELKIDSIDALGRYVHILQSEIDICNRRAKQFAEAMALSSPTLRIYPAVSTTAVLLELIVNDKVGSDLTRTSVYLNYNREKYLPEEPLFKFKGGDESARAAFKNQLACLQYMPLKEALECAFGVGDEEQSCRNETVKEISKESNTSELNSSETESLITQPKKLQGCEVQEKLSAQFKKLGPRSKQ
ncbi:Putative vacuolar protein sorting-associated protein 13A, partial [Frankliniella fusca]